MSPHPSFFYAIVCVATLLVGCEYTVPLVKNPTIPIDPAVVGAWRKTGADHERGDQLLVLPIDEKRFLVSFPSGDDNAMFAEAVRADVDDLQLIQLKWFGTAQGDVPDDDRVYQYLRYSLEDDELSIQLLNSSVVREKATSAKVLIEEIKTNIDNPDLFKKKTTFVKSPRLKRD